MRGARKEGCVFSTVCNLRRIKKGKKAITLATREKGRGEEQRQL